MDIRRVSQVLFLVFLRFHKFQTYKEPYGVSYQYKLSLKIHMKSYLLLKVCLHGYRSGLSLKVHSGDDELTIVSGVSVSLKGVGVLLSVCCLVPYSDVRGAANS